MLHDRVLTEQAILPVPFSVARSGFVLCPEPPLTIGLDEASQLFSGDVSQSDPCVELSVRWGDLSAVRRDSSVFDSGGSWALRRGEGVSGDESSGDWIYDFYTPVFGPTPFRSARMKEDFSAGEIVLERGFYGTAIPDALGFPLAELLVTQRLAREGGVEFHGCGIRLEDGRGVLLVGHSGAGKTTTANLWSGLDRGASPASPPDPLSSIWRGGSESSPLHMGERGGASSAGVRPDITILSDDRIIVRTAADSSPLHTGERGGASSAGVRTGADASPGPAGPPSPASGEGSWAPAGVRFRLYGTPWHGEGRYAANEDARLSAIFVLEHAAKTEAIPISGADAVTALFARAFPPFYDPISVENVLATIDGIASGVPVFRFPFVPDATAVETVRRTVNGLES